VADLGQILDQAGFSYENPRPGAYLVKLEGTHRLATMCWLIAGDHSLLVEAFFLRRPDDDPAALHAYLLDRNTSMYGVAFAVDRLGDVYLVGRLPLSSVTEDEVDRVLGSVLQYADESFDVLLEIGFASSIRREWAWRLKRGESTRNLQAFARFADPEGRASSAPQSAPPVPE
jgi:hypothetical protein